VITGDHVARFYGACLCRMNNGGRSIDQIFSTREILDAVPSIQAAMTKGVLEDLTTCLHYSDDWDINSFPVIRGFRGVCYVFFTSKIHVIKKIKRMRLFGDALEQQFQSKLIQPSALRGIELTSF
jgi:hypothetical protein